MEERKIEEVVKEIEKCKGEITVINISSKKEYKSNVVSLYLDEQLGWVLHLEDVNNVDNSYKELYVNDYFENNHRGWIFESDLNELD